ncbi:endonuclease/exonuclease/phosphatase family protein [Flagellimonas pacifica]|uniref:Endonuclease/exonuclease/phosphatase domain-containing protein n=1 Tax=Flagellimonas pacifica TaxID=1247520 RepID=A0A285MQS4_9FLAO|nr:endonuclease/exonuclease/phosphatase family protein [Allomuricauda parva]SNY99532.1 hypothetical protein SAMN06265377_1342 [Allomuricauda parva]
MKIASFNIENLFHRDHALLEKNQSENLKAWVEEFHLLMGQPTRGENQLARLRELAFLLGFSNTVREPYLVMRRKGGQCYVKPQGVATEKRATAKLGCNGWVALRSAPLEERAVRHKLRTVADAKADILLLQEVEDRAALLDFNVLLQKKHQLHYDQMLFTEGTDAHGRGMAILARNGYTVESSASHAHVKYGRSKTLFEKDCPVHFLKTPDGERPVLINAHFKGPSDTDDHHGLRKRQAEFVAGLYCHHIKNGNELVLICGTLNDPSYADALSPLIRDTQLKDISKHDGFEVDLDHGPDAGYFRLGAYRKGVNIKQADYMLCSQALFAQLHASGLQRRGMWSGKKVRWRTYPQLRSREQQASGHPLLWGQFDIF